MEKRFPSELSKLPQWVCWRIEPDKKTGRAAKVPYNPKTGYKASSNNPQTWGTMDEAFSSMSKFLFAGVGFVFTAESGIVGIDIDHCLEDGNPNPVVSDILAHLPPTYIEISPSGKGLHIFLRGVLPPSGNKNSKMGVEMYSSNRYFTMTGIRWRDCADEIPLDNGSISWIHSTYIKPKSTKTGRSGGGIQGKSSLNDEKFLEMACRAKDGDAFSRLWRGNWQEKYKSQSEADFALCGKLAFWSNCDAVQMDRLFRQSGLFREKWDVPHAAGGATYGETTLRRACESTENTYRPTKKREISIFEQQGAYFRKRGDTVSQLTNFIVRPIEMIVSDEEAQMTCDLVTDRGEVFHQTIMTEDFYNLQRFKKLLNKRTIALCFFGTEGDLEALKHFVQGLPWVTKKGVKALGIYHHRGRLVFVTTQGAIAAGGEKVDTIVQLERFRDIGSEILNASPITKEELLSVGEWLLRYNEPAKTVPILAWTAGCFIKPHLRRIGAKYPHLFLIGEAGSGKSNTLERVILPVFSRSKVTAASQTTAFTLMHESRSSNIIPQAFDEFKPSKLSKNKLDPLYNHFRDSYDCHEGVRGRADQTAESYDLLAPIVVAGEESADEAAIRERTIELLFSKKDLQNTEHLKAFAGLCRHSERLSSLGRSLLDAALSLSPADVREWHEEGKTVFAEPFPSRILSNLACAYAGLRLLARLCVNLGLSWDTVFPLPMEACVGNLSFSVREYLLEGCNHNKTVVEQTFEVMARMSLKPDKDFIFKTAGRHLAIALSGVYDRYTRYRRDYAVVGEALPYAQFCKQLEHTEYFVAKNKPTRFGEDVKRAWVVDFEKLSQVADLAGFRQFRVDGGE